MTQRGNTRCLATIRLAGPLPHFPGVTWSEAFGTVSRFGLIAILNRSYLMPSRLIGHRLVVRIYDDRLEFFLNHQCVHRNPRLHGPRNGRLVNYHLASIVWCKNQAHSRVLPTAMIGKRSAV